MDFKNKNTRIIEQAHFKLKMKELFHILKTKPELNNQLNSQSQYEIKILIITAFKQHR